MLHSIPSVRKWMKCYQNSGLVNSDLQIQLARAIDTLNITGWMDSKNTQTIKLRGLPCCEVTSILHTEVWVWSTAALIGYIHSTGDIDLNPFFLVRLFIVILNVPAKLHKQQKISSSMCVWLCVHQSIFLLLRLAYFFSCFGGSVAYFFKW